MNNSSPLVTVWCVDEPGQIDEEGRGRQWRVFSKWENGRLEGGLRWVERIMPCGGCGCYSSVLDGLASGGDWCEVGQRSDGCRIEVGRNHGRLSRVWQNECQGCSAGNAFGKFRGDELVWGGWTSFLSRRGVLVERWIWRFELWFRMTLTQTHTHRERNNSHPYSTHTSRMSD